MGTARASFFSERADHMASAAILDQALLLASSIISIPQTEGQKLPAHRVVLSACSPYFCAMFTNDMKESLEVPRIF